MCLVMGGCFGFGLILFVYPDVHWNLDFSLRHEIHDAALSVLHVLDDAFRT